MDSIQQGTIMLVQSALDKKAYVLPENFSMEKAEKLILKHQIVGLAYEGAVLCGVSKANPVMQRLFQIYYQQILRDEKQRKALDRLFQTFEKNGIDYLPVKGLDMKKLYPNPAMRPMGDADVLIRMEQYGNIREIMQNLAYQEGEQTGHELIWDCPALHLELHKQLMSSYFPDLQSYYGNGWGFAMPLKGHRYTYRPEDMYIYHFAHLVKHYRRGGIGLRHVLDLWLFKKNNPTMDMTYVETELERLRLCEFYNNLWKMINYWFADGQTDEITDYLTEFFFNSGSWGDKANFTRFIALKNKKQGLEDHKNRFAKAVALIFPGLTSMKGKFPVLNRYPWLLPVMWPVRWGQVLLFRRGNIKKVRDQWKYSSDEEISEYEASLQYVGLYYDVE